MRQRKIKGLTKVKMQELGVIVEPKILDLSGIVHLEIGSGKGQFITSMAKDFPNITYVAMEKNINVAIRIIEKVKSLNLENVIVILDDASQVLSYLNTNSVDYLYLNFSDPWPKTKHHKRRLTHPNFLNIYLKFLKTAAIIEFRTDHFNLYEDSVEYFQKYFEIIENNKNYQTGKYYTEYELKRIEKGNLYRLKGIKK